MWVFVCLLVIITDVLCNEVYQLSQLNNLLLECNVQKLNVPHDFNIAELPNEPIIFSFPSSRNGGLQVEGSRLNLLQNYGLEIVDLTSSNSYSQGPVSMTLEQYIQATTMPSFDEIDGSPGGSDIIGRTSSIAMNSSLYLFGGNHRGVLKRLAERYVVPPCEICKRAGATSVGIAGPMSGVEFHFHGPGFSEAIIGRKLWLLLPGVQFPPGFFPNMTVADWLMHGFLPLSTETKASLGMQICMLRPGDLLYFPGMHMHATLNVDNYNLFASQFLDLQLVSNADD